MIGIDTNVLIRYLVQDEPTQANKANQFVKNIVDRGERLWICQLTLCEVVWVLERSYKLQKQEIIGVLKALFQTQQIQIEGDDVAWQALNDYETSKSVGFSDCLIGRQNLHKECSFTATFDKKAASQLPRTFKVL